MKRIIYKIASQLHRMSLKRKGWVLSDNVVISIHGVKKLGKGKFIAQIM
jgi:hypothetical protein